MSSHKTPSFWIEERDEDGTTVYDVYLTNSVGFDMLLSKGRTKEESDEFHGMMVRQNAEYLAA